MDQYGISKVASLALPQVAFLSYQEKNYDKAISLYQEFDGKVDAFGVGGLEFFLLVGNRRYYFREVKKIRQVVKISKIGEKKMCCFERLWYADFISYFMLEYACLQSAKVTKIVDKTGWAKFS